MVKIDWDFAFVTIYWEYTIGRLQPHSSGFPAGLPDQPFYFENNWMSLTGERG